MRIVRRSCRELDWAKGDQASEVSIVFRVDPEFAETLSSIIGRAAMDYKRDVIDRAGQPASSGVRRPCGCPEGRTND